MQVVAWPIWCIIPASPDVGIICTTPHAPNKDQNTSSDLPHPASQLTAVRTDGIMQITLETHHSEILSHISSSRRNTVHFPRVFFHSHCVFTILVVMSPHWTSYLLLNWKLINFTLICFLCFTSSVCIQCVSLYSMFEPFTKVGCGLASLQSSCLRGGIKHKKIC